MTQLAWRRVSVKAAPGLSCRACGKEGTVYRVRLQSRAGGFGYLSLCLVCDGDKVPIAAEISP